MLCDACINAAFDRPGEFHGLVSALHTLPYLLVVRYGAVNGLEKSSHLGWRGTSSFEVCGAGSHGSARNQAAGDYSLEMLLGWAYVIKYMLLKFTNAALDGPWTVLPMTGTNLGEEGTCTSGWYRRNHRHERCIRTHCSR